MNLDEFLQKSLLKYNNKYLYDKVKFKNHKTKVIITCKIHGDFLQTPSAHLKTMGCKKCSSKLRRISEDEFFKKAQNKHGNEYDYSNSKFLGLKNKITIKCKKHGEFTTRASTHLKSKCLKCYHDSLKYNVDDLILKLNKVHNNKYSYPNLNLYKNNKQKFEVLCPNHGAFSIKIDAHLSGKGCTKCNKDLYYKEAVNSFLERANQKHKNKYKYIITKNFLSNETVDIVCPFHGKFIQTKHNHLIKGTNCSQCANKNKRLTLDKFLIAANKKHNHKYDYSNVKFELVSDKINIVCKKHGEFEQRVASHLYSKHGCPNCSKIISKAETEWLDYLNVPEDYRNKIFKLNGKYFFPDAFNPSTNTIYEFYGDYWHGNINVYDPNKVNKLNKMTFLDLYNRTIEREKFFESNGYKIICIWENDWNNLKKNMVNKNEKI